MPGHEAIAALVPHQGLMCLWEEVVQWDAQRIVLSSGGHRSPQHPLRSQGRLRALHLCEYGAQAMAVHGGLLGRERGQPPRPGLLVALRGVRLHVDYIEALPGLLRGQAELLACSESSQQYAFRIWHEAQLLAEGRAAAMLEPAASS